MGLGVPPLQPLDLQLLLFMVSLPILLGFWILDSGANNRMTGDLSLFISPFTSIDQSVRIADGSSVSVRNQGDAYLSPDTTLSSVYFIPNLSSVY